MPGYIGRFAPSPTGPLHFGSLLTAVASWCDARAAKGRWLLRIEDVDEIRTRPGAADEICRTLDYFGLYWDGDIRIQSRCKCRRRGKAVMGARQTKWLVQKTSGPRTSRGHAC